MLTIQQIRDDYDRVVTGLSKRQWAAKELEVLNKVLALDDQRKSTQTERDGLLAQVKTLSGQVGQLMKTGQAAEAELLKGQVADLKNSIAQLESDHDAAVEKLNELLLGIPNVPHHSVPNGQHAEHNEVFKLGQDVLPLMPPDAKPHWELADQYGIFDLALGVKLTGAGFPVYRGKGARLQRALINYFLDRAIAAGFEEIQPPHMVNADSARGTGQLPDKEGQMYYVGLDELYLIPTAEVPVTNIMRDVILKEGDFPVKMTAYTPCFRREAGSYGAHVRGLNRVHQFDKVEIVVFEHPQCSYDTLMQMVEHVEGLVRDLGLPYRILRLCGGDMGFASALTFDFETYSAAQQRWLEVSSVSNFETFQTNRMKLRYKDADGKTHLAHTLNGSALALPRILATIIENYQTPDGIIVPEVLRPYAGFDILT
jgi:seryl-tRNA synthetase